MLRIARTCAHCGIRYCVTYKNTAEPFVSEIGDELCDDCWRQFCESLPVDVPAPRHDGRSTGMRHHKLAANPRPAAPGTAE